MTNNGFSFLLALAALCACVTASVGQNQECQERWYGQPSYNFYDCVVTNFSVHLPVPPSLESVQVNNVTVLDMDGCVRWLGNMNRLNHFAFSGNDSSYLDCLTRFNSSLFLTRTSYSEASLFIGDSGLPLDDWIAAMFKTLFGKTRYWEGLSIMDAPLVARVPRAFGNPGLVNVSQLVVAQTGVSVIREHDFDGYQFVDVRDYVDPGLYLYNNRICVIELAAFRNVPFIYMFGNPIDVSGVLDWKELANQYPNATAFAKNPVCADELNTAWSCYTVIDTSYYGINIVQRGCNVPTTTTTSTKLPTTTRRRRPFHSRRL